ncbi:MAG: hypothetical protein EZS28_035901, partial [Streblomastix strix]
MKLTDSTFIQPLCIGNMIYLNKTKNTVSGCQFVGYNGSFIIPGQDDADQQMEESGNQICSGNIGYFSTSQYALVYVNDGDSLIENTLFENTGIGAIKIEDADAKLESVQFNEKNSQDEGNELMIACLGDSNLKIINPVVNGKSEQECISSASQNSNRPLKFLLTGEKFISVMFAVKVVQMREKTDDEIKQEIKQFNISLNDDNLIKSTNDEVELQRDKRGYIIWPPDNASTVPFTIMPKVLGSQNAEFKMTDYSWLNSRVYIYGILASNDGVHFSGVDGNQGPDQEGIEIEVEVLEGEQFVNFIRFELAAWEAWLIPPVFVALLTILISGIVYLIWKRYDKKKQKIAEFQRKEQIRQQLMDQALRQHQEQENAHHQDEAEFEQAVVT